MLEGVDIDHYRRKSSGKFSLSGASCPHQSDVDHNGIGNVLGKKSGWCLREHGSPIPLLGGECAPSGADKGRAYGKKNVKSFHQCHDGRQME